VTLTDGFCDFVSSLRHKERMAAHLTQSHHYGQHFTVVMQQRALPEIPATQQQTFHSSTQHQQTPI